MARKRMIDPSFWTDPDLATCEFACRLFFIGTWNFADDKGVLVNCAEQLKALIFPYDSDVDVEKYIKELSKKEMLMPFRHNGKRYLWVINFLNYQKISHPSSTKLPVPPVISKFPEDSVSTPEFSGGLKIFPEDPPPIEVSVVEVSIEERIMPIDPATSEAIIISEEEGKCWKILSSVMNYPPMNAVRVLKLREYIEEFSVVDAVALCDKFATVHIDKPLAKNANVTLQLRKFFENARDKGWGPFRKITQGATRTTGQDHPDSYYEPIQNSPEELAEIKRKIRENYAKHLEELRKEQGEIPNELLDIVGA